MSTRLKDECWWTEPGAYDGVRIVVGRAKMLPLYGGQIADAEVREAVDIHLVERVHGDCAIPVLRDRLSMVAGRLYRWPAA